MTVLLTIINETLKMDLFAAHLIVEIILALTVYALDIFTLFSHLWEVGPRQYIFGDNLALNTFNQPA